MFNTHFFKSSLKIKESFINKIHNNLIEIVKLNEEKAQVCL